MENFKERLRLRVNWIDTDDDPIRSDYVYARVFVGIGEKSDPFGVRVDESKEGEIGSFTWLGEIPSDFYSLDGENYTLNDLSRFKRMCNQYGMWMLADCQVDQVGSDEYRVVVLNKEGNRISTAFVITREELLNAVVKKKNEKKLQKDVDNGEKMCYNNPVERKEH